jgi:hypothetical protein
MDEEDEERRDWRTMEAMIRFGGSFVRALGEAARCADRGNLAQIKMAFPGYWKQYSDPMWQQVVVVDNWGRQRPIIDEPRGSEGTKSTQDTQGAEKPEPNH